MNSFLLLHAGFHFPVYDTWKVETTIFQRLNVFLKAVSGLFLSQVWKLGIVTSQHIEVIEFPVSVVSTPTGDQQPETGPAHLGRVPNITTVGAIYE